MRKLLMAGQSGTPLSAGSAPSGGGTGSGSGQPCCESGRPVLTDPLTGQTVCSCQYDAQLLGYQRLAASGLPSTCTARPPPPAAAAAAYGTEQGFLPLSAEQSAFYSPTVRPHALQFLLPYFEIEAGFLAGGWESFS
ncbi:uncharacterized protein CEXT_374171 [Caerostris extrusa]|uniref:Uncharacterized protein n=1 Tax=Caerostris extrusa TaxID=172846 RepID=A0AAV4Y413_CAEEX|nr:uncharacterized protein CEXT_374171 [Caerostris extrusa]